MEQGDNDFGERIESSVSGEKKAGEPVHLVLMPQIRPLSIIL